jgi:hypothetical protein
VLRHRFGVGADVACDLHSFGDIVEGNVIGTGREKLTLNP